MSSKLKLKPNPTFKHAVPIPVPGAEAEAVEFEFRFFPRKELGDLNDEYIESQMNPSVSPVDFLMKFVVGWNIDAEFNRDNVTALLENYPHCEIHIYTGFFQQNSCARLGN